MHFLQFAFTLGAVRDRSILCSVRSLQRLMMMRRNETSQHPGKLPDASSTCVEHLGCFSGGTELSRHGQWSNQTGRVGYLPSFSAQDDYTDRAGFWKAGYLPSCLPELRQLPCCVTNGKSHTSFPARMVVWQQNMHRTDIVQTHAGPILSMWFHRPCPFPGRAPPGPGAPSPKALRLLSRTVHLHHFLFRIRHRRPWHCFGSRLSCWHCSGRCSGKPRASHRSMSGTSPALHR